jgi:hypothetical protein
MLADESGGDAAAYARGTTGDNKNLATNLNVAACRSLENYENVITEFKRRTVRKKVYDT